MAAHTVTKLPEGSEWLYELKLDGYRALLIKSGKQITNLPDAVTGRWGGGVTTDQMSEIQWTRPKLVAQIRFVEWTAEGRLRHAAFLGLRTDKVAKDVTRES
jgi:ATP-dependent DNA ligase